MTFTSIFLWPLVRQIIPQICFLFFPYKFQNNITYFGNPQPWSHALAYWVEGPETYEPCTRGTLPAQGTLVLWAPISFLLTGITWLLTFCDVCKISIISTQSWSSQDRTRMDPKWRSIGKEFNIIPVGLVHCTAPHPTGFYFWCWVPRVSACISNNASLCQMERTQIVQKRETQ